MHFPLKPFQKEVATAKYCQVQSQIQSVVRRVPAGVCPAGLRTLLRLRHEELHQPKPRRAQAETQKSSASRNLQGQDAGVDRVQTPPQFRRYFHNEIQCPCVQSGIQTAKTLEAFEIVVYRGTEGCFPQKRS